MPQYLTRQQAAAYLTALGLPITAKTLAKYATMGIGPAYHRWAGRVVYEPQALMEWAKTRLGDATACSWTEPD